MTIRIPFNFAQTMGKELYYIQAAIDAGHISGDGMFTKKCQALIEKELKVPKVLLTSSCTNALEIAAILLEVKPGDEVIVPSFTFVSTANAFLMRGARPVFIDIRPDTLNMDEKRLPELITPKTRAILPVHYAGVGCEMDEIMRIADDHGVPVVEDNAHGLFGRYRGRFLGTFGAMAAQSFHETKNFTCGEGGALLVNDPRFIERSEVIREKGTNRSSFFRGQIDKYTWVDIGSNYFLSDILAAFLYAQLEVRADIMEKRKSIWRYYHDHLRIWAAANGVQIPIVPPHCDPSYHLFYMIMPSLKHRKEMIAHLKSHGISSVFHYVPLHLSPMGKRFGGKAGMCPVSEDVGDRLIRLPFFNRIREEQVRDVVSTIEAFY